MQFLNFVPNWKKQQITPADLDGLGLDHVHDGDQPTAMLIERCAITEPAGFGRLPAAAALTATRI